MYKLIRATESCRDFFEVSKEDKVKILFQALESNHDEYQKAQLFQGQLREQVRDIENEIQLAVASNKELTNETLRKAAANSLRKDHPELAKAQDLLYKVEMDLSTFGFTKQQLERLFDYTLEV